MSRPSVKSLLKDADVVLNIICVLFAVGFLALAVTYFMRTGGELTVDSIFLVTVCLTVAVIFLFNPALTLKEKGYLKRAGRAEELVVEEGPIHFEGSARLFLYVLGGLLVLTLVEVVLAYIEVNLILMLTILMGLSIIKAALIMAYFMHLRFERMSLVLTLVPILVVCICLLFIFFPDSFRSHRLRATQSIEAPAPATGAH